MSGAGQEPEPLAHGARAKDTGPSRGAVALSALLEALLRHSPGEPEAANLLDREAPVIHAALSGLLLRTALALSAPAHRAHGSLRPPAALEVARAVVSLGPELEHAGVATPSLRHAGHLAFLIDDASLPAVLAAVLVPAPGAGSIRGEARELVARDAGALHQELLGLALLRLGGLAVRLESNGTWIPVDRLLCIAPEVRSKWLQREAALPKSVVQRLARALADARTEDELARVLAPRPKRGSRGARDATGSQAPASVAHRSALVVSNGEGRRRAGSHYTPPRLREALVSRLLQPLLVGTDGGVVRALRVCDPAMGAGDLLITAAATLATSLAATAAFASSPTPREDALRVVVTTCLYGVDKDPVAVDLARYALSRLVPLEPGDALALAGHLRHGDALVGRATPGDREGSDGATLALAPTSAPVALEGAFDWPREFPEVFERATSGFDACVGNPPWIAYAGRAAQPLDPALAHYYARNNPAFSGYRTLHGLFVHRAASLLRAGGRLGLVLPTSVSDLSGYAETRAAHDALCVVDDALIDFGDGAFEAVFQPCMALTSTRRDARVPAAPQASPKGESSSRGGPWNVARNDLDGVARGLLDRLSACLPLDPVLFGERGFQSTGDDLSHLRKLPAGEPPFVVPIREGTDVGEFARRPPRTFLDPVGLAGRLRPTEQYARVHVLIRQTARYPIAAPSDGLPFRNSVLAGFANDDWTAAALAAYLNSSALRWYHHTRHRDARQGMPQLKIGHLRALPAITDARVRSALDSIGSRLGSRNAGITDAERGELDALVSDAFDLSPAERRLVGGFLERAPLPRPRSERRPCS